MTALAVILAGLAFAVAIFTAAVYLRDRRLKKLREVERLREARRNRLDFIEDRITTISTREWR